MNQIIIEAAVTQAKQTGMLSFFQAFQETTRLCMSHKHVL